MASGDGRFKGKVALITGAGSGIGQATALRLASEGASIVLAGRTMSKLEQVGQEVEKEGGQACPAVCDVRSDDDCAAAVDLALSRYGRLDALLTSAGVHGPGNDVVDTQLDDWTDTIAIDLTGTFLSAKYAVKAMRRQGAGSVVLVSSVFGVAGKADGPAFQAAKGGVVNLTRHMSVVHARENIRVNCICPGVVRTPLTDRWLSDPKTMEKVEKWHPMQRIGTCDEMAAAIAFLLSDEASFITGTVLPVDGGLLAASPELSQEENTKRWGRVLRW